MQTVILDDVPMRLPQDQLRERLRVSEDSPQWPELRDLIREAESIGKPRALCGVAYIDDRGEDYVVIDDVRFSSRVLAVNLQATHRVFPYLATCGTELEAWAKGLDDMLYQYWAGPICEAAMRNAMEATAEYLQATYRPGEMSRMSPGSLADWPLEEQVPLFRLFGDTETRLGVQLTDSLLMMPIKTISGIRFGTTSSFESCMLCPRPSCPNRRAPYDPALYDDRYRPQQD